MKKFDYVVLIGRFEPFHIEHGGVLKDAYTLADNVIVFVGSAKSPRTIKNPFTFEERKTMIEDYVRINASFWEGITGAAEYALDVLPLRDVKYNDQLWAAQVTEGVDEVIQRRNQDYETLYGRKPLKSKPKIAIIGHNKDDSSYYLNMFPQWHRARHPMNENVSATHVRQLYFEGVSHKFLGSVLPVNVQKFMTHFTTLPEYAKLVKQYEFIKKYKEGWKAAPHPVKHVTTDAVVVQSGHILLVTRKSEPGEGLIALPGGHLKDNERIVDGMLRELREETKLKVPSSVLRGSIKKTEVFDEVDRSLIGRVITHAFFIELAPGDLPPVKGNDDAKHAQWYPISDIDHVIGEENFFDDHYHIINRMLGKT